MSEPLATGSPADRPAQEPATLSKKAQELLLRSTPEGVLGWNRYIDRFVVGFVLILVFIACLRPITQPGIWGLLRSGEGILAGKPITSDSLSFSQNGQRWVNIPWLFEVANAGLYRTAERMFQTPDYQDRGAQAGASAIVLLNALLVTLAAGLVLTVRRAGPGLWWLAVCVLLALGGIFVPTGQGFQPSVGGIAIGKNAVDPDSWGLLFLAIELVVLFRAGELGRTRLLFVLPVLFAIWSNIAPNFAFGLMILAAWGIGQAIVGLRGNRALGSPFLALGMFGLSAVACIANPSLFWVFGTAFKPFTDIISRWTGQTTTLVSDDVGFFDYQSRAYYDRTGGPGTANAFLLFYLLVILLVLASFALNYRRFSLPRFLMFLVAAVLWAGLLRLAPPFALVFAAVLGLNGQEWFHDTFGTQGQTGKGWKLFSDAGRALTIVATCAYIAMAVTGYKSVEGDTFGLGYDDSKLASDTADYLRDSGIQGNVLALNRSIGDALLWRDPKHPSYIDNRQGLFSMEQQKELETLRAALRDDDKPAWSKILDSYTRDGRPVSAVIVPQEFGAIYRSLMKSPHWVPVHDGGNAVVFGRTDIADLQDLPRFQSSKLDPEVLAFRGTTSIPGPERPPSASTWIDGVLQYRALRPAQPRVNSGGRWLTNPANPEAELDPARCLLAIRDARLALVKNPDDTTAYELLSEAYGFLTLLENRILTANAKTPEIPRTFANFRYRQRLSALNFAIITAAPPTAPQATARLANLHRTIAGLYDNNNALDLERTHLEAARKLMGSNFPEVLDQQLTRLEEQYAQFQDQLSDFAAANSAGPVQQANVASQQGFPATAIQYFKDAENAGFSMAQLRFALVDLYCQTGQPNEAFDLLEGITANDESLGMDGTSPGLKMARAGYRNGLVYFLLGNYATAARYWNSFTLPYIRASEAEQTIRAAQDMLGGQPIPAIRSIMEISGSPEQPGLIDTYAEWQAELGLCLLESGAALDTRDASGVVVQEGAATYFRRALEIKPRITLRPLLAYYLEKMGQEVPPAPEEEPAAASVSAPAPAAAQPEPAAPAEAKPAEEPATPVPAPAEPKPAEEPASSAPAEPKASETPAPGL